MTRCFVPLTAAPAGAIIGSKVRAPRPRGRALMPGWGGCDVCEREAERFARTLTSLLAQDLRRNPPAGAVLRVELTWTGDEDPLAFEALVLGADDPAPAGQQIQSVGHQPCGAREAERTQRLRRREDLRDACHALIARAARAAESEAGAWGPSPALLQVLRSLPAALGVERVAVADDFGVVLRHHEQRGELELRRAWRGRSTS
jgi:hypothetical protein